MLTAMSVSEPKVLIATVAPFGSGGLVAFDRGRLTRHGRQQGNVSGVALSAGFGRQASQFKRLRHLSAVFGDKGRRQTPDCIEIFGGNS